MFCKTIMLVMCLTTFNSYSVIAESTPVKPGIDRPIIADNQQFNGYGITDNKGLCKNTYQFSYKVKVAATGLILPHSQTYPSYKDSEKQEEFTNPATYRAAISINKGPWIQLTWGEAKVKECAFREMIINDPVMTQVKPGDAVYLRSEITVPKGGKWGMTMQARNDVENNWIQGATNTAEDVLLSDKADFSPQKGLFIHSALGLFGKPVDATIFHSTVLIGDSIAGYIYNQAASIGNQVPIANLAMAGESAQRFNSAGSIRQALFAGCDTMLFQDGVNDMREGKTFEELKSAASSIWEKFRVSGGKHLIVFTITPLSKSTDKWATDAGQTPDFSPAERQKWNDYLRNLSEKDVNMAVTVIDSAAVFESTPNNSLWKPLPKGASSNDGVHPNGVGVSYLVEHVGPMIKKAIVEGASSRKP